MLLLKKHVVVKSQPNLSLPHGEKPQLVGLVSMWYWYHSISYLS